MSSGGNASAARLAKGQHRPAGAAKRSPWKGRRAAVRPADGAGLKEPLGPGHADEAGREPFLAGCLCLSLSQEATHINDAPSSLQRTRDAQPEFLEA